jgi:hypothetical protein
VAVGREALLDTLSLDVMETTAVPSDDGSEVKGIDDVAPLLLVIVFKFSEFEDSAAEFAGVANSGSRL